MDLHDDFLFVWFWLEEIDDRRTDEDDEFVLSFLFSLLKGQQQVSESVSNAVTAANQSLCSMIALWVDVVAEMLPRNERNANETSVENNFPKKIFFMPTSVSLS